MSDKIFLRRGNRADLPTLDAGEPGFATDTKEMFVGALGGNVRFYAPYSRRSGFHAYQSSGQSITGGAFTKVLFQSESYDNKTEYDTANSKFTALESGEYIFATAAYFPISQPSGNQTALDIYVNGSKYQRIYNGAVGASKDSVAGGVTFLRLTAGQYVEVYVLTTNTLTLLTNDTFFTGYQIDN